MLQVDLFPLIVALSVVVKYYPSDNSSFSLLSLFLSSLFGPGVAPQSPLSCSLVSTSG